MSYLQQGLSSGGGSGGGRIVVPDHTTVTFYVAHYVGTIVGGSGGTNGTYNNVALSGGSGSGFHANILIVGNTVVSVAPLSQYSGYIVGDVLTAAPGSVAGFSYTITAVGNDSQPISLSAGPLASPFATIQAAINLLTENFYVSGDSFYTQLTIQVIDGVYDPLNVLGFVLTDLSGLNTAVLLQGNSTYPRQTLLQTSNSSDVIWCLGNRWYLKYFKLDSANDANAAVNLIFVNDNSAAGPARLVADIIIFGQAGSGATAADQGYHIFVTDNAFVSSGFDCEVDGTAAAFLVVYSENNTNPSIAWVGDNFTLNVDPKWPGGTLNGSQFGQIVWSQVNPVVGTSSGPQFVIDPTSAFLIETALSTVPGDSSLNIIQGPIYSQTGALLGWETAYTAADNSGTIVIKPPNSVTSWTMTLPPGGGTNGYVLSTNGSGVTSWIPAGGAATLTINSSAISGSTANEVLYGDGSVLQQSAHTQIISGQISVDTGYSYLYNSSPILSAGSVGVFVGASGNFTGSGTANVAISSNSMTGLTSGQGNVAIGVAALYSVTSGQYNLAVGYGALQSVTTANNNVGFGHSALNAFDGGQGNLAIGDSAMSAATGCNNNTAIGSTALQSALGSNNNGIGAGVMASGSFSGSNNNGVGASALSNCTSGSYNSADGANCLFSLTTGSNNSGIGAGSLQNLTDGSNNIGIGASAGFGLNHGHDNVFIGANVDSGGDTSYCVGIGKNAFNSGNLTGIYNTAVGFQAGYVLTSGQQNVLYGLSAGYTLTTGSSNVIIGNSIQGLTSGSNNVFLGIYPTANSIVTGSNNLILGDGVDTGSDVSNCIVIGCNSTKQMDFNLTNSSQWTLHQTNLANFSTALTNGAAANTGTLTNAPAAGNPTKWVPINDNGTTRYIPAW